MKKAADPGSGSNTLRCIGAVILLLIQAPKCPAQASEGPGSQRRVASVYASGGLMELLAAGFQYQISGKFALGAKAGAVYVGGGSSGVPAVDVGVGIKASYFLDPTGDSSFFGTNVLNLEAAHLFAPPGEDLSGTRIELTVGHDGIEDKGIDVLWAVGGAYTSADGSIGRIFTFFPVVKLGFQINF